MNSDSITDEKTILNLLREAKNFADMAAILEKADPALQSNPVVIATAMRRDLRLLQYADRSLREDKTFLLNNLIVNLERPKKDFLSPDEVEAFFEEMYIAFESFLEAFESVPSETKSDKKFIVNLLKRNANQFPSKGKFDNLDRLRIDFSLKFVEILHYMPPISQDDQGFILEAMQIHFPLFFYASQELQENEDFLLKAFLIDIRILAELNDSLRKSRSFFTKLIEKNHQAIIFADPELHKNIPFLLDMIKKNREIFRYISHDLKSNESFLLQVLEIDPELFKFFTKEEKRNKKLLSMATKKMPGLIKDAELSLKNEEDLILSLIKENPEILLHVGQNDDIFLLKVVTQNGLALQFLRDSLRSHPEIIEAAILNNPEAQKYVVQHNPPIQHRPILKAPPVPVPPPLLSNQSAPNPMPFVSNAEQVRSQSDETQPSALPTATLLPKIDHPKPMPDDLIKPPEQPGKALPSVAKAIPSVSKDFSWVVIGVIGLVLGTVLGLCSWVLGYSLGLSLGILAPLCCLGALAIHWLLSKKEVHSDPDIRKNVSASNLISQDSSANKNTQQESARIFSKGVSDQPRAEPHQSPDSGLRLR